MQKPHALPKSIPRIVIVIGSLTAGCAVEFEPAITPVVWQFDESEGRFQQVLPESTVDPASLEIPGEGSREELLYYADLLGFGRDGRPTIDDYFNPYFTQNPLTNEITTRPTPGLLDAAREFYGTEADLAQLAASNRDNPLIYWEDDPITTLTGNARQDIAFFMASSYNKNHMGLFLDAINADSSERWNYEPAWLLEKMRQEPLALRRAQFQLLQLYAENPEIWEWIQTADLVGPTD